MAPRGTDYRPLLATLRATAEHVTPAPAPMPAAHPEETEQILAWLEQPGVRLVDLDGQWATPLHGAAGARARLGPDDRGRPRAGAVHGARRG